MNEARLSAAQLLERLKANGFIGMWEDREDIGDSSRFARGLRDRRVETNHQGRPMTHDGPGKPADYLGRYLDWLRSQSVQETLDNGWTTIDLPYLDRHNDFVRVFTDGAVVTDGGAVFRDLRIRDFGPDHDEHAIRRAAKILRGLGLDPGCAAEGEIRADVAAGDFPAKLHAVALAMLAIGGLAS